MNEGSVLTIDNILLENAGEIYSYAFPPATRTLSIQARQAKDIYVSTDPDFSTYFTIVAGSAYYEDSVIFSGTFYFKSSVPEVIVEIIIWSQRF